MFELLRDNGFTVFMIALVVVGIPVIGGLLHETYKVTLKHREKMANALNAQAAEKAAQYVAQNERLEQRVRVLERIVTDGGIDVAHEIDRLRDDRAPLN
ncbi:hypothetical protein [Sphingomonas endolithica]|uniref:hypothetical protein n=1 Tax=Sphingomonas endolithica TaxID=2972485 RepID=UPI0021AEBB6D|nr:hypothetical protein [Sphingomonas sp. ZFBP2030]